MSDLTRRVLDAAAWLANPPAIEGHDQAKTRVENLRLLRDAAPVLAQQVEALEALADRLDRLARERDEAGDFCLAGAVGTDAARIRHALRDAHGEARP